MDFIVDFIDLIVVFYGRFMFLLMDYRYITNTSLVREAVVSGADLKNLAIWNWVMADSKMSILWQKTHIYIYTHIHTQSILISFNQL